MTEQDAGTVLAYSQVTNQPYCMHCTATGSTVPCFGSNNAYASFSN